MKFHAAATVFHVAVISASLFFISDLSAAVQPAKPQAQVSTATYPVADILAKHSFVDYGAARNLSLTGDLENVFIRSVLLDLFANNPKSRTAFIGTKARYRIELINKNTLAVTADEKTQMQVKLLLENYRSSDIGVVVDCKLYDVDQQIYKREIAGKWSRHPGAPAIFADPATDATEEKFLKGKLGRAKPFWAGLKPLRSHRVTLQQGQHGEIFSWLSAIPYERNDTPFFGKKEIATASTGFAISLTPTVSADRRVVRMRLTQKIRRLVEWTKIGTQKFLPNQQTKEQILETPVLQEASFTSNFAVFDGWPAVVSVQWLPSDTKNTNRQLVLVVTARIRIEAEERIIQKQQPKKQR